MKVQHFGVIDHDIQVTVMVIWPFIYHVWLVMVNNNQYISIIAINNRILGHYSRLWHNHITTGKCSQPDSAPSCVSYGVTSHEQLEYLFFLGSTFMIDNALHRNSTSRCCCSHYSCLENNLKSKYASDLYMFSWLNIMSI